MWMATCSMHVGETIALMFVLLLRIRAYSLLRRRRRLITVTMSRHRYRYTRRYSRAKSWASGEPELTLNRLYIIRYALHRSTSSADPIPILGTSYASLRGARLKPFAFCCRASLFSPLHYAILLTLHAPAAALKQTLTLCSNLQARR